MWPRRRRRGVAASRRRRACGGSVCVAAPSGRHARRGTTGEASQGPPTTSARRPESRDPVSPGIGSNSKKRPPAAVILGNDASEGRETASTKRDAALRTREKDPQHEANPEPRERHRRDDVQERVGPLGVHDLRGRIPVSSAATSTPSTRSSLLAACEHVLSSHAATTSH